LFAQNGDRGITGDKLDQECYERDDGPNNQQQNYDAAQTAEQLIPKFGAHRAESCHKKAQES
jgi:hypothetical protein